MSDYTTFYNVFLTEMPMRVSGSNDFNAQLEMIHENLQYDAEVIGVAPGVFKIESGEQITYWVGDETATNVSLIVDTSMNGNFCKVELTSKNPSISSGTKPFASDLYLIIKSDVKNHNLIFSSDSMLSDDGIKLWKGITKRGGKVSVYDKSTQQYVLSPVSSEQELEQFIGDANHMKYVFVLSESLNEQRGIITSFGIMEIKRMANWPLFEHLKEK